MKPESIHPVEAMINAYKKADQQRELCPDPMLREIPQEEEAGAAAVTEWECGPLTEMYEELDTMFRLIEESNCKIRDAARQLEPLKVEARGVPSALGLTVAAASGKLKNAELTVKRVSQQYHPHVKAGHVIAQVPGPGGTAAKGHGVQLIISKGPPPEKEKHDVIRKREDISSNPNSESGSSGSAGGTAVPAACLITGGEL